MLLIQDVMLIKFRRQVLLFRTFSITFAIGSALAAIAGILHPSLMPTTGSMPSIRAFTAAVFGGIGSIPGAMIGGILLGVIQIFGQAYISTQLSDAIVFAALIIVLLIKPTGFLGKTIRELVPICAYIVMAVSLNLTVGILGELSLGHAGFMSLGVFSGVIAVANRAYVLEADEITLSGTGDELAKSDRVRKAYLDG